MKEMFPGAVVAGARSSKHDFFGGFCSTKESTFMMVIYQKTICGGQDLTIKITVWKLKISLIKK